MYKFRVYLHNSLSLRYISCLRRHLRRTEDNYSNLIGICEIIRRAEIFNESVSYDFGIKTAE